MEKNIFYKLVKGWLESKGYKVLITAEKREIVVPVKHFFPIKNYITPDAVGIGSTLSLQWL